MVISPVWRDLVAAYSNLNEYIDYTLKEGGKVIFNGRCYKYPTATNMQIYINRIVRDYLSSKIDFSITKSVHPQPNYMRTFALSPIPMGSETNYTIYNDCGYDNDFIEHGELQILSRPLSNVIDPRQYLFCTYADFTNNTASHDVEVEAQKSGYILAQSTTGKCNTFTVKIGANYVGDKIAVVDSRAGEIMASYEVRETCADYCLYYLNTHGGYDHLLIRGNSMRTDALSRVEMTRDVNNNTLQHGKQSVSVEVQPKWRLYTDCLTDAQWALTHHLLGSTHVFLHDLTKNEIVPVVITASNAEYHTYSNQGRKKTNLTIDVEAASKMMRK